MSRACCYSVSHADTISSITTMQWGEDAMSYAKKRYHPDIVSALEQVVRDCCVSAWIW